MERLCAEGGEACFKEEGPISLVVSASVAKKKGLEVVEEGTFVRIPALVILSIEDRELCLRGNVLVWSDVHTSVGTELKRVGRRVPYPLIGVGEDAKTSVVGSHIGDATLDEPVAMEVEGVGDRGL